MNVPQVMIEKTRDGLATFCRCWRLDRRDGVVMGFTDHDRDLVFDGVVFRADTGLTPSAFEERAGLAIDGADAAGALSDDALTAEDIEAGVYDRAAVSVYLVDWQSLDRFTLTEGEIGEIARGSVAFRAELNTKAAALAQPIGRTHQIQCDATLGDARCGVDLAAAQFTAAGSVVAAFDRRSFTTAGLQGFAKGWFDRGEIEWRTGANAGRRMEIRGTDRNTGEAVDLWRAMPDLIAPGDTFLARAGCDKTFATCVRKFQNAPNHRGNPFQTGDRTLQPNASDVNDGTSRFNLNI